jgi:2-aminoadipate transaminase
MFEKFYSNRIINTPPSFIRESLKVIQNSDIISFAGGLPNPISFPQKELNASMNRISEQFGSKLYQYASSQGLLSLREYIANRYNNQWDMNISPENILITTGSQQALDLIGKVFINKNDSVLVEKPSYLGFIQALCMYDANFISIKLNQNGLDIDDLTKCFKNNNPKIAYLIPNFQNPTGIMYSKENRNEIFEIIKDKDMLLIQDDPYGELIYNKNEKIPYIGLNKSDKNIYLGSFSKIIAPGMRLGYIIAHKELIRKFETAKQASDLHTNIFCQYLIADYLKNNNLDNHINKINTLYKEQAGSMLSAIKKYFPKDISYTTPKGGMFVWVTLKENQSSLELFDKAIEKKVAFIPGMPFYINVKDTNTLRLNYTNATDELIDEGIKRLAAAINEL